MLLTAEINPYLRKHIMSLKYVWFSFLTFCLFSNFLFSAPLITNVSSYFGPSSGGTAMTITGSGFTGATAVNFGCSPTGFVVQSDTVITTTSPVHSPQVVLITVTTPSGTSLATPDAYFVYQGSWLAYVTNATSSNIAVIDTATDTFTNVTPSTTFIPFSIAFPTSTVITPDGTKVYVTASNSNNVVVIDTATNTFTTINAIGNDPFGITMTPDGTKAYVANFDSNDVAVIDTATDTFTTINAVGIGPTTIAITPDGTQAYVTNNTSNNVAVINTATDAFVTTPFIGVNPGPIAVTPDGTQIYVIPYNVSQVSVIDTMTNAITAIPTAWPISVAITPDGAKAYVSNQFNSSVTVIDTATNTPTTISSIGTGPTAIMITPDGTKAYVANSLSNNIAVIDTTIDTFTIIPSTGNGPCAITITPDGKKAYIANINDNNVAIIDTVTDTLSTISSFIGSGPNTIVITPDQAPLAKFTFSIAAAGLPSSFDASTSRSPVGNIANYFWDFGDGGNLTTTSSMVSYTYAIPGIYAVTLTVTNSAGTSTQQIFNFSSSFPEVFSTPFTTSIVGSQSPAIMNNGGPTAISTQTISVP